MRRTAVGLRFHVAIGLLPLAAGMRPVGGQPIDRPVSSEVGQAAAGFDRAYAAGKFTEALEHALRLAELHAGLGTPEYNVACVYARLGNNDEAIGWLERAIRAGYDDPAKIANDADLASIRHSSRFQELLARAKEQAAQKSVVYFAEGFEPDKPVPLIVVLHNFGGNARSAMNLWREAADEAGAVLVAPKAPKSINPAQQRWTTPGQTEKTVLEQINHLRARYQNISADRIILAGLGQGGEMGYHLALKHPELFRGVISAAGHLSEEAAGLIGGPGVQKLRAYIMVGEEDREADNCRQAAEVLRAAGMAVELRVFPGLDRFFPEDRVAEQGRAIAFVLGESGNRQAGR